MAPDGELGLELSDMCPLNHPRIANLQCNPTSATELARLNEVMVAVSLREFTHEPPLEPPYVGSLVYINL